MVQSDQIQALSDQIARAFQPGQIILFGSYAYGIPGPDSHVDLLVVMPYPRHAAYQAVEILTAIHPGFPVDVVVRAPTDLGSRVAQGDFFLREVVERGRVLYAGLHG
ncbi:MAG: nucleotidyltransferase domain-containing protein [Chloroflexales bacterium]|nr:nucleotidyltransferase domain-containing protein [Chloroflexales bacterium]